jgi:hypothetical protein
LENGGLKLREALGVRGPFQKPQGRGLATPVPQEGEVGCVLFYTQRDGGGAMGAGIARGHVQFCDRGDL